MHERMDSQMSEILIEVKNLDKQYMKQKAVNNANFQIKRGMICGLIGPNGAGKTTIMKMLGGLAIPTGGSISIFGETSENGLAKARSRMSFMIETPYAKEKMTARENLEIQRLQKGIPDKKRIDEVLEIVNLTDTGKKPVKNFSLGMRQRLGIAIALAGNPDFLVLDEPINGLDPQGIVEIRELVLKLNREKNITFLISSHILDELSRIATYYGFIDHGSLVKEMSAEELNDACRKCVRVEITKPEALTQVLDEMNIEYKLVSDNVADIYAKPNITQLTLSLADKGCEIISLKEQDESLESFYIGLLGGENNA